jgi:uncharacterized protein
MPSADFVQAIIHGGINGQTLKRDWQSRPQLMANLQLLLPFNANASHCNRIVDTLIAMAAEADQTPSVVASVDHPLVVQLAAHPAATLVRRAFVVELSAHFFYRMASQINAGRWRVMFSLRPSQGRPKRWHVDGIGQGMGLSIALQQWRTLLCRGALCALLVPRLLCFQGECDVREPFRLAQHIASRRHFLGSNKDEAEGVFEGQRLYGEQRFSEAAERWGRAALLQHAPSHAHLSNVLILGRQGVTVKRSVKRGFALAAAGAALGCAHSKGVLGRCYVWGHGVAKDVARGLALGRESEAAGSCFGQFVVGQCYDARIGVAQDYTEAVRLYSLAAAQGHARAQNNLGVMFESGQGVAQDYAEAVRLYSLAAARGYAAAQCDLGRMFESGKGVAQDYAEAVRLFRLAAAQGDAAAQHSLGIMFEYSKGVVEDRAEAIRWYRLAAAQGNASAQTSLRRLDA